MLTVIVCVVVVGAIGFGIGFEAGRRIGYYDGISRMTQKQAETTRKKDNKNLKS